jgi:hypothetical protein
LIASGLQRHQVLDQYLAFELHLFHRALMRSFIRALSQEFRAMAEASAGDLDTPAALLPGRRRSGRARTAPCEDAIVVPIYFGFTLAQCVLSQREAE